MKCYDYCKLLLVIDRQLTDLDISAHFWSFYSILAYLTGRPVPDSVDNALECVSNQTLCDAMRQLASLLGHADSLFTELTAQCSTISRRSAALAERLIVLDERVAKYNPKKEKIRKFSYFSF
jgi:hypothetical protein